jgi:hypothetical protein
MNQKFFSKFAEVNRVIAIFFICIIATPLLSKVFLVSKYIVDYHYYVTVLCENKDRPELKCNGTCHLAKEIKASEENADAPELARQISYEPAFFQSLQEYAQPIIQVSKEKRGDFTRITYSDPHLSLQLPPPRA